MSDVGRYADRPGDIPKRGWVNIGKRTFARVGDADVSLRCAGAAFFSFLSIFPVLACFVIVYGIFASPAQLQDQLSLASQFVPASVMEIVRERLESLISQPEAGLTFGLVFSVLLAFWSGSRGVNALIDIVSQTYYEKNQRSFVTNAILSVGLTLGALVVLTISLVAIAGLPAAFAAFSFGYDLEWAALLIRWPILAFVIFAAICVLFRFAPDRESALLRWIVPGAALATVLWIALAVGFSFYVENFGNYGATFGSLSVAVVLMLWIYYSAMVIALGASFNAEMEHQTKVDTTIGPSEPMGERGAYVADNLPES